MIFVTVGTTEFERLIRAVDRIAPNINEKVLMQIGRTNYMPNSAEYFKYKSSLLPYFQKADLVISHGGAGTIFEILTLGKKLITVENPNVNDSHQWDLLGKISSEGYCIWCKNPEEIYSAILFAKNNSFKRYTSPYCNIPTTIRKFLERNL